MISRVTPQTQMAAAERGLQASATRMGVLQQKATDLRNISKVSDDPAAAADSLKVRAEQRAADQYSRNIENGAGWMATADSAMTQVTNLLNRVRDLTLQGVNGSISPEGRNAIAVELDGLKQDLLGVANSKFLGRTIFAGNSDTGAAFTADYSFTGSAGSTVERRVSEGETIRVDVDGRSVFGEGPDSVFALIGTVADGLREGSDVSDALTGLEGFLKKTIGGHAELGARHSRLLRSEEVNMEKVTSLENQRSDIEDADLAKTAMALQLQNVNYQAALAVTSKVLQNSLMDFLR